MCAVRWQRWPKGKVYRLKSSNWRRWNRHKTLLPRLPYSPFSTTGSSLQLTSAYVWRNGSRRLSGFNRPSANGWVTRTSQRATPIRTTAASPEDLRHNLSEVQYRNSIGCRLTQSLYIAVTNYKTLNYTYKYKLNNL